jgi:hypothetical protein
MLLRAAWVNFSRESVAPPLAAIVVPTWFRNQW